MGNCARTLVKKLRRKRDVQKNIVLLMVGLDNAGKTLVLNRIAGDPDQNVLPTIGFHTISLKYKSYGIKIYDVGGSPQIRALWPKYYNDVHGLIYVVDASDISRLTENKVTLGELISHENISGKPLLLLANKQDLGGAIDELDLVENLDVERIANMMRCPTRVEICSCRYPHSKSRNGILGIINGYKWLLDTILKNYTVLNERIKDDQSLRNERLPDRVTESADSPESSIHSNPFKPIHELFKEQAGTSSIVNAKNGVKRKELFKRFLFGSKNKTAPIGLGHNGSISQDALLSTDHDERIFEVQNHGIKNGIVLEPLKLDTQQIVNRSRPQRPFTAPVVSQHDIHHLPIQIPGQVSQ
ncbi:ADP-ribosylation factor-like protein 13B [Orussus abietinus]|uniref:ADP-ribosylation factor-like protein 13B n=1 Tax=Orussus abietinus TaxID=222816 RepID=UPI000625A39A|nr:ADP-ribosylation factor-like protein 13B [Orussus abietinus]